MDSRPNSSQSEQTIAIRSVDEETPLLLPPPADDENAQKPKHHETSRSNILLIYVTFIGVFIASADEALVISTYSEIASQFQRLSEGSWLLVAYNFGYCVALPVYGVLSDSYGCKNALLGSYVLFMIGCLACGASTSLTQLVFARGLTGVSGAGITAVIAFIVTDILPPSDFALYRGYQNVVAVVGRSVGAPIGGILADTIGWRWSFYGQIPCMIICTLIVWYALPASPNRRGEVPCDCDEDNPPSRWSAIRDLDIAGILILSATILSLLYLLQSLQATANEPPLLIPLLVLALVLSGGLLVTTELLWAKKPLIPIRLLGQALGAHCLSQVMLHGSRYCVVSNIFPYFIRVQNEDNFHASMSYIPVPAGVVVGGVIAGQIIKRTRRPKPILLASLFITVAAFALICIQWRHGCSIWGRLDLLLLGFGPGMTFPAFFAAMSSSIPEGSLSKAISTYFLSQQLGMIMGPACGAALSQGLFERNMRARLGDIPHRETTIHRILNDARFAFHLPPSVQSVVRSCYLASFKFLPLVAGITSAMVIPIVVFFKDTKLESR